MQSGAEELRGFHFKEKKIGGWRLTLPNV